MAKVYHIPGSLAQQKGAINYNGSMKIDGDIKGRIVLKAAGDILVGGNVEGANLEADGNIYIGGGMISSGGNIIVGKNNVHIEKEVEGIEVRCLGDLSLGGRVSRCRMRVQGRVNAPKSIMRDVHMTALCGILAFSVECSAAGASILRVGINYRVLEEIATMDESIERKKFELQHLLNNLGPMLKKALGDRDYGRRMGQDIDTEMNRARAFSEELDRMNKKLAATAKKSAQNGVACVSVARSLQKGVQICAEKAFFLASENINGPMSLVPDKTGNTFIMEKGLLLERLSV